MASMGFCRDLVVLGEGCDDAPADLTGMGQDIPLELYAGDGALAALMVSLILL